MGNGAGGGAQDVDVQEPTPRGDPIKWTLRLAAT